MPLDPDLLYPLVTWFDEGGLTLHRSVVYIGARRPTDQEWTFVLDAGEGFTLTAVNRLRVTVNWLRADQVADPDDDT